MATIAGSATAPSFLPAAALSLKTLDVTLSASYPTGGETVALTALGMTQVYFAHGTIKTPAGSVTGVWYDPSTNKLKAFTAAGEVANATNLSALVAEVVFYGRP
jgi:hypothetical protein